MPAYFRRTVMNRQKQECSPRNPEEKQRHAPLTGHFEVYHQNFPVPGQKRRYQAASGTGCCSDHKQGRSAHSKGVFRLTSDVMPGYPSRHRCSVWKYQSKNFSPWKQSALHLHCRDKRLKYGHSAGLCWKRPRQAPVYPEAGSENLPKNTAARLENNRMQL